MDLRDYVRILRKSWALILAITVVGIALGVGLTLATTKVYQANSQVFVSSSVDASQTGQLGSNGSFITQRVESYPNLATAPRVIQNTLINMDLVAYWKSQGLPTRTIIIGKDSETGANLTRDGISLTASDLKSKISADVPANSVVVNLHVQDTNPQTAYQIVLALTDVFDDQVANFYEQQISVPIVNKAGDTRYTDKNAVQLSPSQNPVVPSAPIKPNKILNIGVGLVLGLIIGVGVAIVREILDNTVKSARDFEELGIPMLAQVAFDKRAARNPIAFRGDAHSARSEAYRQLRTNLQFIDVDNPPRIIAITSAIPGEGKSSTAVNLAAALAEAGSKVCLIEADLRRPSIAKMLGLVSDVGFTTAVIGKAPVETVLQNAGRNLAVLTCGPIPPNPSELLISQHAKQVIFDIADKVDYVIIDTPPLLPVTDGAEISTIADATLLVHRAARTTRDQAARSLEALEKVGRRPVGVILNMVTRGGGGRYDYEYGYYYAAYRPNKNADAATPAAASGPVSAPDHPATTDPFGTGASAESSEETLSSGPRSRSSSEAQRSRRQARHRDAENAATAAANGAKADADAFAPVGDAPDSAYAAPDEHGVIDAEVVAPEQDASAANGQARAAEPSSQQAGEVDDAYDYDDYYDEDETDTFAPVPATDDEAPAVDQINGTGEQPVGRGRRRGRR